MRVQRTLITLGLAAAVLGGCSDRSAFYVGRSSTTTPVIGVGPQRPADTLGPPSPTTTLLATGKTGGSKIDMEQIIGRWRITEAPPGAAFSVGDRLAFLGDGAFSINETGLVGTWKLTSVMTGAVIVLDVRTIHTAYGISFVGPGMQLSAGEGHLTLVRTN